MAAAERRHAVISPAREARYEELAALERAEARRRLELAGKGAVTALCAYEVTAILTGRLPTVSTLCRRRRWVEAALLAVLLAHLHHAAAAADTARHGTPTNPSHPNGRNLPDGRL